jgi:hypothetical protein
MNLAAPEKNWSLMVLSITLKLQSNHFEGGNLRKRKLPAAFAGRMGKAVTPLLRRARLL